MRHKGEVDKRDKTRREIGLGVYRRGLEELRGENEQETQKRKGEEYMKKKRRGSTAKALRPFK